MGKILAYIITILLVLFEGIMVTVFGGSLITGGHIMASTGGTAVMACGFLLMLLISLATLGRLKAGKRFTFISGIMMHCTAFLIMLFALTFFSPPFSLGAAFTFGLIALLSAVPIVLLNRATGNNEPPKPALVFPKFEYEKAEHSFEPAMLEFCRRKGYSKDVQPDSRQCEMIEGYAAVPMAYFLQWLACRGYLSEGFTQNHGEYNTEKLRRFEYDPVDFLYNEMDGTLTREDLAPEIQPFVDFYFLEKTRRYGITHHDDAYCFDYFQAVSEDGYYYLNEFTRDKFDRLAELLDMRLSNYSFTDCMYDEEELKSCGRAKLGAFEGEVEVMAATGVDEKYEKLCLWNAVNMSGALKTRICGFVRDELESCGEEIPAAEAELLQQLYPSLMTILPPRGEEAAYMVFGECEYDPEHGFSISVRGDYVLEFAQYRDSDSPWSQRNQERYEILSTVNERELIGAATEGDIERLINAGKIERVFITPTEFGGMPVDGNFIFIPPVYAKIKLGLDGMAKCLFTRGLADSYTCEPRFMNGCLIPYSVTVQVKCGDDVRILDTLQITHE